MGVLTEEIPEIPFAVTLLPIDYLELKFFEMFW